MASTATSTPVRSLHDESYVARRTLNALHYAYPILLLFFFLVAFTAYGVVTAPNEKSSAPPSTFGTGPGGKPLPLPNRTKSKDRKHTLALSRSRKLLFDWLSVFASGTFVANAVNVIAHALVMRKERWWCGQAYAVRFGLLSTCFP